MSSSSTTTIPPPAEIKEEVKAAAVEAGNDFIHSMRAFAAGGVGGVCAVLTGHPFDLVKVHMQTAEKGVYGGAMDVVRKIVKTSGPKVCSVLLGDWVRENARCANAWMFRDCMLV
jgi:solute carrier family 25 carnitine/acylcarnitine transporter 20/29